MTNRPRVAITMGDAAGIGAEITVKSLARSARDRDGASRSCSATRASSSRRWTATGVALPIRRIATPADADRDAGHDRGDRLRAAIDMAAIAGA